MKTITDDTQVSIYVFEDDKVLDITAENIIVGDPVEFIIADCNSSNTTLHEDVEPPADWKGCNYLFDGTTWTANGEYESSPSDSFSDICAARTLADNE